MKVLPISFTVDSKATCTCIRSHSSLHRLGMSTEHVSAVLVYPWCQRLCSKYHGSKAVSVYQDSRRERKLWLQINSFSSSLTGRMCNAMPGQFVVN